MAHPSSPPSIRKLFDMLTLYNIVLASVIFPAAFALPSPSPVGATESESSDNETPTPSANSNSGTQMSDVQLAIMLSVIGSVVLGIAILIFLRKRLKSRKLRAKEEDQEPLSASFQPGELPTLPYWPRPKSPPPQGLA